jgi:hypothetical protein
LLARAAEISQCLADHLPYEFEGFTTNFSDPEPNGVRHPVPTSSGPIRHMVEIFSVRSFWQMRLGIDLNVPVSSLRWLTLPQQRLLELTSGDVFHDEVGELTTARNLFAYFPEDVWRYLLASGWQRISREEAFVGRTSEAKDELGAPDRCKTRERDIVSLFLDGEALLALQQMVWYRVQPAPYSCDLVADSPERANR